jgi:NitT/TauT family transport system permease protein
MKKLSRLKQPFISLSYRFAGLVILFLIWQILGSLLLNEQDYQQFKDFLPIPAFKALYGLFLDSIFWDSTAASLRRVGIGLSLAFIFGVISGIFIGFSKKIRALTHLPMQFIRMISPLSWMPIAILLLPTFDHAIYFLILMASIWPIMHNTSEGLQAVNPDWINMARLQGASRLQLITKVLLPSSLPNLLNGLRLALGIAWIILVPAEYLGINNGLGYLINDARDTLEYDRLMALVIAIGILGFGLDGIFRSLVHRFDWRLHGMGNL